MDVRELSYWEGKAQIKELTDRIKLINAVSSAMRGGQEGERLGWALRLLVKSLEEDDLRS